MVTLLTSYIVLKHEVSRVLFNRITEKQWEQHEEVAVLYGDLKASIDQFYDENIAHRDQTNKLVEASMSSLDSSSTTINDPAANQKINEATETFTGIYSNISEVLSLVKGFDFFALLSNVKDLQAHALKQEEASAACTKSSTNMAWNLSSRMTAIEISQTALKSEVSSLRQDTSEIKSMMAEIYQAFKGQPSSAPSRSVTPTLALTHIPANFEGENATNTATEEPPSHTKGETGDTTMAIPISLIHPTKIQEYWDKEEKMKKVAEEAKLLAMTRPEVIKVVQEEAEKIRLDPRKIASAKAGEKFKKAQDAEHEVLKREHSKKVKRLTELNKRRAEEYIWTMTNIIKPEPIIDVRIHPDTKPIVASVFRNNDKRNFEVHQPFKFSDFGITELDELGPIIQKKKISVVKYLMTSLSKRYERLKKIPEELGIQYALRAPVPEQTSSQTSGRKRKHMELEPEVKVPGLECNRSLPEGVPFANHMVIKEPEYEIFFIDVFGDQAFLRWDDIHKVGIDSLISYLVMASMVKTEENARFSLKLRKLIADHP
ncbi:hypothetical protein Tco_1471823, partial [Tanacetum coccineum]